LNYDNVLSGTASGNNPPTPVPGLSSGVIDIAAGETHACVLLSDAGVECWGGGLAGELNNGSYIAPTSPTLVAGLGSPVTAITAGDGFSCAVTGSGQVQCWGNNGQGELGNGSMTDSPSPVTVTGLPTAAVGVWADQATSPCALLKDGTVWCWGSMGGATQTTPVQQSGFAAPVVALATGGEEGSYCALLTTGAVQCWGTTLGDGYTLGDPANTQSSTVPLTVLPQGAVEVRSTDATGCALMTSGQVECWGDQDGGAYVMPGL
jgi:alpha-tubulin suppressor-like RCC1 family protein